MKRYLQHMHNQDPHDRRTHALHVASLVTGLVFVGWVATLGMRFAVDDSLVAQDGSDQAAAVVQATQQTGPRLEVSTTSVFLPQYSQY